MNRKYFNAGVMVVMCMALLQFCTTTPAPSSSTSSGGSTNTACSNTPNYDATLTASSSTSVSHNAGKDCMSCHNGSKAKTTWAAAGTMAASINGTTWASAGSTITNVSSTNYTLTVDTCGNFYATNAFIGTLRTGAGTPTAPGGTMKATSFNNDTDGSCNRSGCHDNTGRSYVY
ncbi:MAG: hypothetical protein OEV66_10170 [Spirochaetia bacterium]|nr:hypothetical protein [Spirochaetia bacterium]